MHDQYEIRVIDRRHRHEVAQQVEGFVVQQRLVDRMRVRHHQQCVAIGRRLRHQVGADHRARAWPIIDNERLPKNILQALANVARVDIGWPTGGERHDDPHRVTRIRLRQRERHGECGCEPDEEQP